MTDKTCFVIAPIGEPDSEIRKRSDQTFRHVITPAVTQCGYDPTRADKISEPGLITSQIIEHVVSDALVIADLTGQNANVFYELAIRHAVRKPFIQLIKEGEQIPFDNAPMRTIQLDLSDPDSVEEARQEIIKQIKVVETNEKNVQTPFSIAVDLRQGNNPEKQALADILTEITSLRNNLANIDIAVEGINLFVHTWRSSTSSSPSRFVLPTRQERKIIWEDGQMGFGMSTPAHQVAMGHDCLFGKIRGLVGEWYCAECHDPLKPGDIIFQERFALRYLHGLSRAEPQETAEYHEQHAPKRVKEIYEWARKGFPATEAPK